MYASLRKEGMATHEADNLADDLLVAHALVGAKPGVHVGADNTRQQVGADGLALLSTSELGSDKLLLLLDDLRGNAEGSLVGAVDSGLDVVGLQSVSGDDDITHEDAQGWEEKG